MTSPLLPSTHASLPPDTPAHQRPGTRAPLPPETSVPQHPSTLVPLLRLWEAWKSFTRAMGGFQSRILLSLFYFFVVTPFGLAVRIFGDPLNLRRAEGSSNWIPRNDGTEDSLDGARKQF